MKARRAFACSRQIALRLSAPGGKRLFLKGDGVIEDRAVIIGKKFLCIP